MFISTCKYIQNLLAQNSSRLTSVVADGAALIADNQADLGTVLESLYLDDDEIEEMAQKLEVLTLWHRILTSKKAFVKDSLTAIEGQIFWILGFKPIETSV